MKLLWISGFLVFAFFLVALLAPWLAHFGPETVDIFTGTPLSAPSDVHWFGTDYVGRDVFSRLVFGIRNSISFAVVVVALSTLLGVILGGILGFYGGVVDLLLSRFMEIMGNFPIFLLQLIIVAFLAQSYTILVLLMLIVDWIPYCRFSRAEFLRLRNQEFVQAASAMGASKTRLFFRHLLPNSLSPIFTYVPFDLSGTITALGALSFLGFGEPINVASLGELLKEAKDNFREAWWLAVFPGGALFLLTLSLTLFGSALRDYFDPRSAEKK